MSPSGISGRSSAPWLRALAVAGLFATAPIAAADSVEAEGEPQDVRVELSDGIVVNWTLLTVEVTTSARGWGVGSTTKAVEHAARGKIAPDMAWAARRVQVDGSRTVADLLEDPDLAEPLQARTERWSVAEARYYTSGRVELVGELSLQELLKPWALAGAQGGPESGEPGFTGVVVDARGTGAVPAYAPRILHGEDVLYAGVLWDDVALFQSPAVYVPDPAHPASARAGDNPLVLVAAGAQGSDLLLGDEDHVRFRTGLSRSRVLGEGTLVVVIGP